MSRGQADRSLGRGETGHFLTNGNWSSMQSDTGHLCTGQCLTMWRGAGQLEGQ